MTRAAFLDRDGVINRKAPEGDYITRWAEVQFLPGVADAIGLLNQRGFLVIVVTNQRCVAKGLISSEELKSLHHKMRSELKSAGARIDEIYSCVHDIQHACNCRKPAPGLLLEAARTHGIMLTESWMIGDSAADMQAGRNAGCRTVLIADHNELPERTGDVTARSLLAAVYQLLDRNVCK